MAPKVSGLLMSQCVNRLKVTKCGKIAAKCERYAKDQSVVRAAGIVRKSKVGCEPRALRERSK